MRLSRVAVPEGSSSHQEGREWAEVFFFFLIFMYSLHRTWLQHVGSPSIPRDGTCPASLAVQSLSHGTPRAVPMLKVFIHDPRVLFRPRDWSNV